jgi:flagellar protein FlaG
MDLGAARDATAVSFVETPQPLSREDQQERRDLIKAVKELNRTQAFGLDRELTFAIDRQTGRTLVRILNRTTGEVVNQIPSEEALRLARTLQAR